MEIRKVVLEDAQLLFNWANDLETRANSFRTDQISWESHLSWLEKKLQSNECAFFIMLEEGEPVGIVRFEGSDPSIIGVTVAPNHRGKGLASKIIFLACQTYREQTDSMVLAYIKLTNLPSLKAFEKAGFTYHKTEIYEGEECHLLIF